MHILIIHYIYDMTAAIGYVFKTIACEFIWIFYINVKLKWIFNLNKFST